MIGETGRELPLNPGRPFGLSQQQSPRVRGDLSSVEPADDLPPLQGVKRKRLPITLCRNKARLLAWHTLLSRTNLFHKRRPLSNTG